MPRRPSLPATDPVATALAYHEATKHHPHRYAVALGYLDWASRPDPFRTYPGATKILLPRDVEAPLLAFDRAYDRAGVAAQPLCRAALADFLRHSLAISAWKRWSASRWALRVNPSSGNLHPTEAYLMLPLLPEFGDAGVWHYAPLDHSLERRARVSGAAWQQALPQIAPDAFLVGLTSVVWREAWKYGERAFRYCQHDVGHALAALAFAAAMQGWHLRLLPAWSHMAVAALLGCDRAGDFVPQEREEPELMALVTRTPAPLPLAEPGAHALRAWREEEWSGPANRLSREHHPWPILDEIGTATRMPATGGDPEIDHAAPAPPDLAPERDGRQIVQQRRSAVALDGTSVVALPAFVRMLRRALPRAGAPWDAWPWQPQVHLLLFVHRVTDLPAGLYILPRSPEVVPELRACTRPELHWERAEEVPADLPLYRLWPGDYRRLAGAVSCEQDIAADGFFSLGMLARCEPALRARGAWFYRALFWETGMIGQVLYLEAEAGGGRATGIGCFFDDSVHDVLGLRSAQFQSLYHFTVGVPVEDGRLTTEAAYGSP